MGARGSARLWATSAVVVGYIWLLGFPAPATRSGVMLRARRRGTVAPAGGGAARRAQRDRPVAAPRRSLGAAIGGRVAVARRRRRGDLGRARRCGRCRGSRGWSSRRSPPRCSRRRSPRSRSAPSRRSAWPPTWSPSRSPGSPCRGSCFRAHPSWVAATARGAARGGLGARARAARRGGARRRRGAGRARGDGGGLARRLALARRRGGGVVAVAFAAAPLGDRGTRGVCGGRRGVGFGRER